MAANIAGTRRSARAPVSFADQGAPPVSFDVGSFDPALVI